jgi:hypothetical protein
VALCRHLGGQSVRGNHEHKILTARADHRHRDRLGAEHVRVTAALDDDDWGTLEGMPLWLDLPEHGVRVVHGGVLPGHAVEKTPPEVLLKIRTVDSHDRWSDKSEGGELWGARYVGPPHVVFGHNAREDVQLHPWATGIDTGCVYGGRLTAVVLGPGEAMPRGEAARNSLVSVPAARRYAGLAP